MYKKLNPENAFIWRITHRDNLAWYLEHGLHCPNSAFQNPNYVAIGNPDIIGKRACRTVPLPPGGMLNDYVPFYFTPFSPMMYNIHMTKAVPGLASRMCSFVWVNLKDIPCKIKYVQ